MHHDRLAQRMLLVDKLQRAYELPSRWRRHVWHGQMQHGEGMSRQGVGGQWRFRHREDRTDTSLCQPGQLIIEPLALLRPPFFFARERVASLPAPRTRAARQHTLDHPIKTRSYRIPGSWHVRMSYTDAILVPNP